MRRGHLLKRGRVIQEQNTAILVSLSFNNKLRLLPTPSYLKHVAICVQSSSLRRRASIRDTWTNANIVRRSCDESFEPSATSLITKLNKCAACASLANRPISSPLAEPRVHASSAPVVCNGASQNIFLQNAVICFTCEVIPHYPSSCHQQEYSWTCQGPASRAGAWDWISS